MNPNFLELILNKTEVIIFSMKEKRIAVRKHLESLSLEKKDQVRNLLVVRDSDLTASNHIKAVINNISRMKRWLDVPSRPGKTLPCFYLLSN